MREYDIKHWENIQTYLRSVKREFWANADRVAAIFNQITVQHPLNLNQHPELKKAIERELRELANRVSGTVVNGIRNEWTLANNKNDAMLEGLLGSKTLPRVLQEKWMGRNLEAMQAFLKRSEGGMGLSDRIWQTVRGHSADIERHLALGVYERTPARTLATEMKQFLNEPDRLFRRVRDAEGNLRLSKAAREYSPGRGKYRSAYKNALRLTRTETNRSYQRSDAERWKQQDYVLGVRVQRSNVPYDCDICEAGAGDYPKDYEWDAWHPNCRCVAVSILASEEDMLASVDAAFEGREYKFDGYIQDIPDKMKDFMKDTGFKHWGH